LQEAVIQSKNPEWCTWFAREIAGADIERLQEVVIQSGNIEWCYNFAQYVPCADIERLQEVVIQSNDPYWCYKFAYYVPGADIQRLQKIVIQSKDPEWCYRFACDVPDADIQKLQEVVIQSGDPEWCYYFALNVPDADINKLFKIVRKSCDKSWIDKFISDIYPYHAKDFFNKIFDIENEIEKMLCNNPRFTIWFNETSSPLQDEVLAFTLENDTDGKLSCWLLMEVEGLTEKQKNRIVGNIIDKDTENQHLPFVHYLLGISQEELDTRTKEHKIMDNPEELLIMDR